MVEPSQERGEQSTPESRVEEDNAPLRHPETDRDDDRRPRPSATDGAPDRRRKRAGERRQEAGFNDDVERAFCAHFRQATPETFPVQHRQNVATRKVVVVAQRDSIILYCDGVHSGDHAWPDGRAVEIDAERG